MIARLRHALHRRKQPLRYAYLKTLLSTQNMGPEAALKKQQHDLECMVRFAAARVPYYGETLAPFLHRDGIDLSRLPILSKDDVVGRLDDLLVREADHRRVKRGHTGGSTGKPVEFWYDDDKHELMRAGMMRSYMLSGWRPGQKILNFWGARQDVGADGVFGSQLGDFIAAERTIAAHEYTDAQLHDWARVIQSYHPVLLQGYPSVLGEVARLVLNLRLVMPKTLIGVYSTAEVLTQGQRERMEQAFGCKVFNQYGSREIPNIGCECRHGNMHVFTDMVYLESVDTEGEDRLLVTSLTNRLMPFIRYDIGDTGRLLEGGCDCGLPFPLMAMNVCRQNDLIRMRSGKAVHPSYFNRLLYGMTQIRQYQWLQRDRDSLELNVVTDRPLSPETHASLELQLRSEVEADLVLNINYLDHIPKTSSGKHRFVIGMAEHAGYGETAHRELWNIAGAPTLGR